MKNISTNTFKGCILAILAFIYFMYCRVYKVHHFLNFEDLSDLLVLELTIQGAFYYFTKKNKQNEQTKN